MSYPPPPGGYPAQPGYPPQPRYPPQPGAGYPPGPPTNAAPYPPGTAQGGPWVPGVQPPASQYGMPPPPSQGYPPQPGMPAAGGFGFGGPPQPIAGYPAGPSPYPQGPAPSSYPPPLSSGPSPFQPHPSVASYPSQPPSGSSPYSPQTAFPDPRAQQQAQRQPPHRPPLPAQHTPTPGGYHSAPPPVPSAHTHHASVTEKMGAVSLKEAPKEPPTEGTVTPHPNFDAEADANTLRVAMKGLGTDERAIIKVLAYRSNSQRQEIKTKFKSMYGKDLILELKSELSGHFEDVVLALLMTPSEYDAYCVREAMKGLGTAEDVLIEILCTRNNEEILIIRQQYKSDYGRDIEKDIRSETSGHFKRLLISMLTGSRDSSTTVDIPKARADAQALYKAGEARWGTDESKFNQILAARSFAQLRAIFDAYSKICKYDIEQSISREMSGDLKEGMLTIVKCVRDKSGYFAERLYKSMKGLGTDDRTLVRVMVSRCEVDMLQIKKKFWKKYFKTLSSFIKGDTSGDYKRMLMALARSEHDDDSD